MADSIRLIGAALPRTGTMSVKSALEIMRFGNAYHMHEVFLNPPHVSIWERIGDGVEPDWNSLFEGYTATLDGPACFYWREQMAAFPHAKVLLLLRDAQEWYESVRETVYRVMVGRYAEGDPALRMIRRIFLEQFMGGRFEQKEEAVARYLAYCEEVIGSVPADRLLKYEVGQGWEPLCAFLECEIPDIRFPVRNTRDAFRQRAGLS